MPQISACWSAILLCGPASAVKRFGQTSTGAAYPGGASTAMTVMTGHAFLFVQHERDRQVHLILRNLSIFAPHLLFLDPCAADVPNRLAGPGDSLVDASSKLFADVELISVTLATDM